MISRRFSERVTTVSRGAKLCSVPRCLAVALVFILLHAGGATAQNPASAPSARQPRAAPAQKARPKPARKKPPAATQKKKEGKKLPPPVELTGNDLITRDGVQLKATFYPGVEGKETVPVLLLHTWKGSSKEYAGLVPYLQSQGHAVLVPDLRGHGESTHQIDIYGSRRREKELDATKFNAVDFARMVQYDMGTLRSFLLRKNNEEKLNLNKLVIVGAEMGAAIAVDWAAYDWSIPNYEHAGVKQSQDVKALVLISPQWSFRGLNTGKSINHPAIRDRLSIMLVVGKEDTKASGEAQRLHTKLSAFRRDYADLPPAEKKKRSTLWFGQFSTKLQGAKLLAIKSLGLPTHIAEFIDTRVTQGERNAPWMKHTTTK